MHLIDEVPYPPPGKLELAIPIGDQHIYVNRPALNSLPGLLDVIKISSGASS
jgi:hypothetical protein